MRFDWYQATVDADPGEVLAFFESREELADVVPVRPQNGYQRAAGLIRGGQTLVQAMWGGNGGGVNVKGSGFEAVGVAEGLREGFKGHRVTRCDVCEDWKGEGLFDRFAAILFEVADQYKLKVSQVGDWHRAKDGRTLYLGSSKSAVRVRFYEKGLQPGMVPDRTWVRGEVMVRPKGRAQREAFGRVAPPHAWSAAAWAREIAERIAGVEGADGLKAGTVYRESDRERALYWMAKQYGGLLREVQEEQGGWAQLGEFLGVLLQRIEEEARLVA